ncbi:MAG: hypothetical protein HOU81_27140 [Hamadaea sp.]|uniref:hypothetical protein n=1 Tax=Hamadaea sp. TaxID=2024425 RepID=UPI0017C25F35|nr:hypothetical protein [Hamadaea sp.]NUR74501.1 hypothetical protein [Hamadaea sp.]NUT21430.1 hypothetical protein [Hamadaea sp.]
MTPPASTLTQAGPGRHRTPDPPYDHRRVAVLVVAAVALVLAAGISIAAFVAVASDPGPPAGTRR